MWRKSFVTKFDASGTALVYSSYLGGSGYTVDTGGDSGNAIAVDAHANAYITGTTVSSDFPIKNAFQKNLRSGANAFVTKLDRDGDSLVYSTYLGGSSNVYTCAFFSCAFARDSGSDIAVDTHGNAYITGTTVSSDFPIKNAFQQKLKSAFGNAFMTKLDRDGDSLVYSTFLGGSGNTSEVAIALDEHGHVYVTGRTVWTDFPIKNAFQKKLKSQSGTSDNAFLRKSLLLGTRSSTRRIWAVLPAVPPAMVAPA